jgi:hypothetical protein
LEESVGFGEIGAQLEGRLKGLLSLGFFPQVKIKDTQIKVDLFILGINPKGLLVALQGALVFVLAAQGHSQAVVEVHILGSVVNGLEKEFFGDVFQAGGQEGFRHFGAAGGWGILTDAPGLLQVFLGIAGVAGLETELSQFIEAVWI